MSGASYLIQRVDHYHQGSGGAGFAQHPGQVGIEVADSLKGENRSENQPELPTAQDSEFPPLH